LELPLNWSTYQLFALHEVVAFQILVFVLS
jgi:hypothetical protein